MTMRFPKYHLATSVVNRILNVANRVQAMPLPTQAPQVPDASRQGQAIDNQLATPPASAQAPPGTEEMVAIENMGGGSAADAVTASAIMDEFA